MSDAPSQRESYASLRNNPALNAALSRLRRAVDLLKKAKSLAGQSEANGEALKKPIEDFKQKYGTLHALCTLIELEYQKKVFDGDNVSKRLDEIAFRCEGVHRYFDGFDRGLYGLPVEERFALDAAIGQLKKEVDTLDDFLIQQGYGEDYDYPDTMDEATRSVIQQQKASAVSNVGELKKSMEKVGECLRPVCDENADLCQFYTDCKEAEKALREKMIEVTKPGDQGETASPPHTTH